MLVAFLAAAEIAPWVQGAPAPSVVDEEVGETAEVVDAVEPGVAPPVVVVVGDAEGVLEHPPRTIVARTKHRTAPLVARRVPILGASVEIRMVLEMYCV
jgi:hypothetical protein